MPTVLYLKCSQRIYTGYGQYTVCGEPMVFMWATDEFVHFGCPKGHKKRLTRRYVDRFILTEPLRTTADFPGQCLVCSAELNPAAGDSARGVIECGGCGTRFVYNADRRCWEVAEVR